MDPVKPASELVIAKVKGDSNLGRPKASGGDMQLFLDLVTLVNSQGGVLRQSWGLQIENPQLFVWQVDWATYEQTLQWTTSPTHATFVGSAANVFNFAAQPPIILYSQWNGDASTMIEAPVTELSFFSLPLNSSNEQKQEIVKELEKIDQAAVNVGRATAAMTGYAIQMVRGVQQAEDYCHSYLSWQSVEASKKWRESPEHADASVAVLADFAKKGLAITPADFRAVSMQAGIFRVSFMTS